MAGEKGRSGVYKHHPNQGFQKDNTINIGKPRTKETKEKIGKAHIGLKASEETKKKSRESHLGQHSSPETEFKKGLIPWIKGRKMDEAFCEKVSEGHKGLIAWNKGLKAKDNPGIRRSTEAAHKARRGVSSWNKGKTALDDLRVRSKESHYNWKGGISRKPYPFEWTETLKEAIRQLDNYTCQLCHIPQRELLIKLCVHHVDYDKNNLDPRNLVSLCGADNAKVNFHREKWIKYFKKKVGDFYENC